MESTDENTGRDDEDVVIVVLKHMGEENNWRVKRSRVCNYSYSNEHNSTSS